ncbi:MAG: GTPase ObgE [Patescibacteria group bacterium]|nr:GTPase ObgE [Patescibacteria group bacterium]
MFIDELVIHVKAGNGGNGVVRWRHEKNREYGGPSGGDGGRGGDIYALATRNINLLSKYRTKKKFESERGFDGKRKSLHGADRKDLDILLPIGSIITNKTTGQVLRLDKEGERVLLLKGGKGGYGNEHFKSSTNQRPMKATNGRPGGEADFLFEVELIADVGLIGLPNAGKTSLLNTITKAKGKIGDYPFTTIEPHLGEFYGYIISDIPGLIEGAAKGKGLGHKFLRHIRRTTILVHLVSLENENVVKTYKTIRKELEEFDKELLNKKEIVLLTKTDVIEDKKKLNEIVKDMKKIVSEVETISLYDDNSVKEFSDFLIKELKK